MNLEELKAQRAKLDEQIAAAEKAVQYPWSAGPWKSTQWGSVIDVLEGEIVGDVTNRIEQAANLRLIAAAPELFMMLEQLIKYVETEYRAGFGGWTFKQAKRLLARVRGG